MQDPDPACSWFSGFLTYGTLRYFVCLSTQDPDEFWVQDLVGCSVRLQGSGEWLGHVVDVASGTGTHDVLVLQLRLGAGDIKTSSTR
jgi:hypothetical protein